MTKPKVILISGIYNTGVVLKTFKNSLQADGFIVEDFVPNPNDASVSLVTSALDLEKFISSCSTDKEPIVIIGFSMGGLIARYYVQKIDQGKRVQKLITISSPHNGTLWARILPNIGTIEMRPHSKFLVDLAASPWPNVPCISLWTPYDLTIRPAKSSLLNYAKNIRINAWCHMAMMKNAQVLDTIRHELNLLDSTRNS